MDLSAASVFFLGNLFQQWNYLKSLNLKKDFAIGTTTLILSLILFYWHINEEHFILHITLYYVVNLVSVYAFIYLSRSLNNIKSRIITLISIGTLLIFGLHRMMIGVIDFGIEKVFHRPNIIYNWSECLLIALMIELFWGQTIQYFQNHYPILLGKKNHTKFG